MSKGRVILSQQRFALTCERICQQLIEKYDDFEDTCIIGIAMTIAREIDH